MGSPRQLKGRVKSFSVETTQEAWRFDVTSITGVAPATVPVQGNEQPHMDCRPAPRKSGTGTSVPVDVPNKRGRVSATSSAPMDSDDDDFVPAKKHQACSTSADKLQKKLVADAAASSKPPRHNVNIPRHPAVRCEPAIFNQFTEHLTMSQRRKISEMGFGGLLQISADRLETSALLVFLMDKLNPDSMVIDIGHENGLQINQIVVNKVLGIPYGDKDPPSSTEEENERTLAEFKKTVHVEPNRDVTRKHLLDLIRKLVLDDDLAVRIFFVVAFNKLLFPGFGNNIRARDAFMTKHMYVFRDINWCKAVIDDLRQAALIWRSEKHKTIPGCALLLQIFYLDNLRCNCSIQHKLLPRARFFDNCTMQNIIIEDKRKDKARKETYGKLPLKNIASTCYHFFEPDSNESPEEARSTSSNTFPSIIGELGGLVSQIASTSSRNNAFEGMKVFDAKARQAIESVQMGSKMLVEAHSEFISTIRSILQSEVVEKRTEDNQHPTTPSIDITMSNVASHHNRCCESSAVQTDQPHSAAPSNEISDEPQKLHSHQGDASAFPEELQPHLPLQTAHDGTPRRMAPDCFSFAPDIDAVIRELSQAEKMQHAASVATNHDHGQLSKNGDEFMPSVSINTIIPPAPCHNVRSCSDPMSPIFAINPQQHSHTGHDKLPKAYGVLQESRNNSENITQSDAPNVEKVVSELTFASTQNETGYCIRARPTLHRIVNVPTRYRSPFKCVTNRPPINMPTAVAVRGKFCTELNTTEKVFISGPTQVFRGIDIAQSFGDGAIMWDRFMSYFVDCLRADDKFYRPNCVGYRVFLSAALGEMLNHDEGRNETKYPDLAAMIRLEDDINQLDVQKVKLWFVPIRDNAYYMVYCLNMVHKRIDVLDSNNEDISAYHEVLGERILSRLNVLFQKATFGKFKDFSRWKRPIRNFKLGNDPNDSGFISMKLMEFWDGDILHMDPANANLSNIRSEMLFYMLFHPINQQKLPAELEALRLHESSMLMGSRQLKV